MTNTDGIRKMHEALREATRTGNHEMAALTRRALEQRSGESWVEHYNRRFHDMMAIPADELI